MIHSILLCKECGSRLNPDSNSYVCACCFNRYPIRDGILILQDKAVNLRISKNIINLHEIRENRILNGLFIKSDIEYYTQLAGATYTDYHSQLLSPFLRDSIILDIGCGQIPYINSFSNKDKEIAAYYGLDLSEESLLIAKKYYKSNFPLIFIKHSAHNLPFPDNSVDVIISSEVLEHLDNPISHLQEINRVCKVGGYLSLSMPCASMYFYPYNLAVILMNPLKWYKKINSHRYWAEALTWHPGIRPSILRKWIVESGFHILRHETKEFYYNTPVQLVSRVLYFLEKLGVDKAGDLFHNYVEFTARMLSLDIPIIKWLGIRQFILCQKIRDSDSF